MTWASASERSSTAAGALPGIEKLNGFKATCQKFKLRVELPMERMLMISAPWGVLFDEKLNQAKFGV